jgi:hypothetical protein
VSEIEVAVEHDGLADLLAAPVLVVDGDELTGRDLLAAGVVAGEWQRLETQLTEGLALVAREPPPDEEVADAVRAFRVARSLLSAEDLRGWMSVRGLVFADVKAAAARSVARRRGTGWGDESIAAEEVCAALPAEAICSGALLRIGLWLADRILSTSTRGTELTLLDLGDPRLQRLVFEESTTVAGNAASDTAVERAERLRFVAAIDDGHREWESAAVQARDIRRVLREKELEWCRYELYELRLQSTGAAAEASRQLVEGTPPARVAESAGVMLGQRVVAVADAPPELAHRLAGAVTGDLVGPWSDEGDYVVNQVRSRQLPTPDDEESVVRAHDELLAEAVARLRAGRIRWHERA